jgi:hypothetical protein
MLPAQLNQNDSFLKHFLIIEAVEFQGFHEPSLETVQEIGNN